VSDSCGERFQPVETKRSAVEGELVHVSEQTQKQVKQRFQGGSLSPEM